MGGQMEQMAPRSLASDCVARSSPVSHAEPFAQGVRQERECDELVLSGSALGERERSNESYLERFISGRLVDRGRPVEIRSFD